MINDFVEGKVLFINKPLGWTSFDVVNKIRCLIKYTLGIKKLKIGHAGTLDPLATGLLIICTGKFTKKIVEYQSFDKEYTGTFFVGATTPSFDLETEVNQTFDISHITDELVKEAVVKLTGTFHQTPPTYSAKKIDGERAYEYARNGREVTMKSKEITISEFEITNIKLPNIEFRVKCSKGTYIRSLAKDFGEALNCGAYLSVLCRTKIGEYLLGNAISLEQFETELKNKEIFDKL